jgi:hypothetical protein
MFDEWEFLLVIELTQHLIAARKLLHFYHLPVFRPSHSQPAFPQKDTDPKNGSRNITFSERLSVRGSAQLLARELDAAVAPATPAPAGIPQ